jgi:uncharacterized coiled-coil protein SlyX
LTTKRVVEAVAVDKNAKLEALAETQAQKIAELNAACTSLKQEKENVMARYRRLSEKHKALVEKAEGRKLNLQRPTRRSLPG